MIYADVKWNIKVEGKDLLHETFTHYPTLRNRYRTVVGEEASPTSTDLRVLLAWSVSQQHIGGHES